MPFTSKLFQGDHQLTACQVVDSAHLTLGARGEPVAKVQLALNALDSSRIERGELLSQTYGPSTAKAVLAYKTRRQIINFAYQKRADDIVGKMTIKRLDQELALWEITNPRRCDCRRFPAISPLRPPTRALNATSRPGLAVADRPVDLRKERPPQLNKLLRIYVSITRKAAAEGGYPKLPALVERARDCLAEHGMTLSLEFRNSGFADTINFPHSLVIDDEDVPLLRKASEDARPGAPSVLRVIVCPRSPNAPIGETYRKVMVGGVRFPPFVVLNSNNEPQDDATLIHEMIHASLKEADHDAEPFSVFFRNNPSGPGITNRTVLKPDRATSLSKSFFAAK